MSTETPTATKFCKNCKHCILAEYDEPTRQYEYARCGLTSVRTVDMVSGVEVVEKGFCHLERKYGSCGLDATRFES